VYDRIAVPLDGSPVAFDGIGPGACLARVCDPNLDTPMDPLITCLDGSAGSEAVLPWATGWAARTGATIALVRVIEPLPAPEQGIAPTAEQLDDLAYLGNVGDRIANDHRGPIRHDTVQDTDPAAVIAAIAETYPDAMVALAASGMKRLADLLVGSTTGDLLRMARVPLFVATAT
jgi:nucleotide-binding universal stress UspA family protein